MAKRAPARPRHDDLRKLRPAQHLRLALNGGQPATIRARTEMTPPVGAPRVRPSAVSRVFVKSVGIRRFPVDATSCGPPGTRRHWRRKIAQMRYSVAATASAPQARTHWEVAVLAFLREDRMHPYEMQRL